MEPQNVQRPPERSEEVAPPVHQAGQPQAPPPLVAVGVVIGLLRRPGRQRHWLILLALQHRLLRLHLRPGLNPTLIFNTLTIVYFFSKKYELSQLITCLYFSAPTRRYPLLLLGCPRE